jgi:eukaryotic-like serine/threonine-protein kinase
VHYAADFDAALKELDARETALIIADIANRGDESLASFKVLKHERPEILVITLTEASDSELVIDLINQAQIFRFINKPVNPDALKQHTQAALTKYQSFKQNPHLTHQHKVEAAPAAADQGILAKVKALKGWF